MSDVRFGIKVESDNGHHVHLRLFSATGGQHLGGCGQLTMTATEHARFRELLAPALTDRPDPAPEANVVMGVCGQDGLCDGCKAFNDGDSCGITYPKTAARPAKD